MAFLIQAFFIGMLFVGYQVISSVLNWRGFLELPLWVQIGCVFMAIGGFASTAYPDKR